MDTNIIEEIMKELKHAGNGLGFSDWGKRKQTFLKSILFQFSVFLTVNTLMNCNECNFKKKEVIFILIFSKHLLKLKKITPQALIF